MAHKIKKCPRCGRDAIKYEHKKTVSCVHCKNEKLDLQVQAEVPPGKIKTQPIKPGKAPLFAPAALNNTQSELF